MLLCISRVQLDSKISIIDAVSFLKHGCHIPWICYALWNRRKNFTWRFLKFCNIKNKHSGFIQHSWCKLCIWSASWHMLTCQPAFSPVRGVWKHFSTYSLRKQVNCLALRPSTNSTQETFYTLSTKRRQGSKLQSASSIFYLLCDIFYSSIFLYSPKSAFLFSKEIHLRNSCCPSTSEILL